MSQDGELIIFDLDNTLADTFPHLKSNKLSKVYMEVPIHCGMTNILKECLLSEKRVIILSARSYKFYIITKSWVKLNLFQKKKIPLFLVTHADDKLPYLIKALEYTNRITYYDDLSYNHENGNVKFYSSVIKKINKLPINYIGYDEINQINANA